MRLRQKKDEELPEEQIRDWQEVTGPALICVVLEEGRPRLAWRQRWSHPTYVFLNGAFGNGRPKFDEFAADALRVPGGDMWRTKETPAGE